MFLRVVGMGERWLSPSDIVRAQRSKSRLPLRKDSGLFRCARTVDVEAADPTPSPSL
ncbi:protein of unknown function [Bradyrhizobium vignae]|uniref:Uncharacterized protein n=1 Tax=Bradyrhizobium vignae TaxID=1549949 RepID=A0A2U3PTD8_9BRAD|nr:protein of unknown function [Bradyrhizobium vignae]